MPNADFLSSEEISESDFFRIQVTAPYNIVCVCRSWRELVLSTASLWNDVSLAFSHPPNRTLEQTKFFFRQHLSRSRNLPLTCHVKLDGEFDERISCTMATLLAGHQKRWRSVKLWFDLESYARPIPIPVPIIDLSLEGLGQLEELNYAAQYRISATSNNIEPVLYRC